MNEVTEAQPTFDLGVRDGFVTTSTTEQGTSGKIFRVFISVEIHVIWYLLRSIKRKFFPTINVLGVDGMWSAWNEWSSCSKTCDGGEKQRHRTCTNPKPKPPGRSCNGRSWEEQYCNQDECSVTSK